MTCYLLYDPYLVFPYGSGLVSLQVDSVIPDYKY